MAHQTEYQIISFLSGDAPLWYISNRLTDTNQKIKLIAAELRDLAKKHEVRDLKVAKLFNRRNKGNIEVNDAIVGFKDRETEVLDHLIGGRKSRQVISIFGMSGVGKTTLAKKLFHHPSVKSRFDKQSWCVVSQKYESQSVLAEILSQINGEFGKDSTSKMDEESLVVRIHKTLCGRRYLVVIDDVWDSNLWDDLMRCFPDDGNGSRILFTTRNKDVGPSNCKNYELSPLSNVECWELLQKKVFGKNTCPHELIQIGKKIAAHCGGLPLAVVVVAGILSAMGNGKNDWEYVRQNLASLIFDGEDKSVLQILKLSYENLPERLQCCFLYLRVYARRRNFRVGKLMRLWISEGFIHKEQGKSAEDVALEYLMELIDKSLVMVAERGSDGAVKTCLLHDLLRDLCSKICEDENFLKTEHTDIYSIFENGLVHRPRIQHPSAGYIVSWSYCQQFRTLHEEFRTPIFFPGGMRLLRVLEFNFVSEHITGVDYLLNLRYLFTSHIPESIGNLVKLEYLEVGPGSTVCVTPAILSMMKLRYFSAHFARYDDTDYNSFQTNNLEFLSGIMIKNPEDAEVLKCSPNLRKLRCMYESKSPNFDLSFLSHLQSLELEFRGPHQQATEISFPLNIKKLKLVNWRYKMSVIGRLEKLEVLKLEDIVFEEETWETEEGEFQKLKFLSLYRVHHLKEWTVESSGHFPLLQRLKLSSCENLHEIPSEIGEIATLQLIEVGGERRESLVESAELLLSQQLEMGNEELRVLIDGKILSPD